MNPSNLVDFLNLQTSENPNDMPKFSTTIRGSTSAEWTTALAAILALVIAGVSLYISIRAERRILAEDLLITVAPRFDGYLTSLIDGPRTQAASGRIGVFWSVLLANNSERTVSLIDYRIREIKSDLGKGLTSDRSFGQGLFSSSFAPIELPIAILPGEAVRFHVKANVRIESGPYEVARRRFGSRRFELQELFDYLDSKGYTISGVKTNEQGLRRFLDIWMSETQVGVLYMTTSRSTRLQAFLEWPRYVRIGK